MADFFKDENGKYSSTRLVFIVFSGMMILSWAGISVFKGVLQEIPWTVLTLMATLMTGKVVQAFREAK